VWVEEVGRLKIPYKPIGAALLLKIYDPQILSVFVRVVDKIALFYYKWLEFDVEE
jgi:hypothetical protein